MLSAATFLAIGKKVHESRYSYDRITCTAKDHHLMELEIFCPDHGSFWQNQEQHIIEGQGCPECDYDLVDYKTKLFQTPGTTTSTASDFVDHHTVFCPLLVVKK